MKSLIVLSSSLLVLGLLAGCTTTEVPTEPVATAAPTAVTPTTPASGTTAAAPESTTAATGLLGQFVNNVHATSGTVKVTENAGRQTLVFTNFRTDGGPDLRIYLAENTGLRNFVEVSRLTQSGNFSVDLPAGADPAKQRYVLIWCKAFSVLFGSAELK